MWPSGYKYKLSIFTEGKCNHLHYNLNVNIPVASLFTHKLHHCVEGKHFSLLTNVRFFVHSLPSHLRAQTRRRQDLFSTYILLITKPLIFFCSSDSMLIYYTVLVYYTFVPMLWKCMLPVFLVWLQGRSGGTRGRSWLRHRATSRKVADLIPLGVTGIFHWQKPGVD